MTARHWAAALGALLLLVALGTGGGSASASSGTAPTYATYQAPGAMGSNAYEPSIGVNYKTGAVLLQSGLETEKVTFDAAGAATWTDITPQSSSLVSLDPILATDNTNGRVFVSQLTGFDSLSSYSDDDGATWQPSQGGGIPSGVDHQSIGSGPYPADSLIKGLTSYPNAVYYCSQEAATAFCARSDNGGATFGPGIPIYTIADCGGLHGHVRVGPDGTVYVPNKSCDGKQGVAVSRDAGLTWSLHLVPGSTANPYIIDPSMAAGRDNTAYLGFVGAKGQPAVSVTRDHGQTFSEPVFVGEPLGVENATFPEVIAGDGDRAAFAFLGTTTPGNAQSPAFGVSGGEYTGAEYHLYVATTTDRGAHWTTVDATGADPVQRGRVCNSGTTCTSSDRNLADFMDIQVDKEGRVLVGWPDGCIRACVTSTAVKDNTLSAKGSISRQVSGPLLFASSASAPVARPVGQPGKPTSRPASGGGLAATGASEDVALLGLLLLAAGLARNRRRQTA